MSDRKNIDRLFQEKFKDFEVTPPKDTWANIEAKLDKKKKRRVIPFWWKLSGVAAVLLIGFLLSKSIYNREIKPENSVVNENNSGTTEPTNSKDIDKNKGTIKVENPFVNGNNSNKKNTKIENKKELKNNNSNSGSDAIANTNDDVKNNVVSEERNEKTKTVVESKSSFAERKASSHRSFKDKTNSEEKTTETVFEKQQNQVAQNQKNNSKSKTEKYIVQTDVNAKKTQTKSETLAKGEQSGAKAPVNLDDLKGNVNSKIATKEIEKKVNDTAKKNSVANNVLEELLNEKESKKKESKVNRWQLTSNVAPIFLGSVNGGSPIDSTLSKNSKSYNTNVGFGVGVSYAVSKKLSVRTGLNKVNMSYNTNDILFFTGLQSKTLENVKTRTSSAMIHVESANTSISATSETGFLPFENTIARENKGSLNQEMGYLEMPVEMTYSLLDKKFAIKIIGGFSTLFLQDNKITIVSQGRDTVLGEANNLNDVHFSTNVGLGIKYGFLKSFEFNVEPTVKYQMNTFSSNAGNFKPYLFGIYSGISYKF